MEAKPFKPFESIHLGTYFRSHCHHETVKKPVCISCSNKGFFLRVIAKTDAVAKGQFHWQPGGAEELSR